MWHWIKVLVANFMVAVGIDWPNMADGDKLNAVVGFGIGVVGLILAVVGFLLSRRQKELAEIQHRYWEEQQAKYTDVRIRMALQDTRLFGPAQELITYINVVIKNAGTKTADGVHWQVLVPDDLRYTVQFANEDGQLFEGLFQPISEDDHYHMLEKHYPHKLFPGSREHVATLAIRVGAGATANFKVLWRIRVEDGPMPPVVDAYAEIIFNRLPDNTYEFMYPWPWPVPPFRQPKKLKWYQRR